MTCRCFVTWTLTFCVKSSAHLKVSSTSNFIYYLLPEKVPWWCTHTHRLNHRMKTKLALLVKNKTGKTKTKNTASNTMIHSSFILIKPFSESSLQMMIHCFPGRDHYHQDRYVSSQHTGDDSGPFLVYTQNWDITSRFPPYTLALCLI